MTGAEVRSLCLSLPEVTEKETWGDEENAGHPGAARVAAYVGRYGWIDVEFAGISDAVLSEVLEAAWERTAPKTVAKAWRAAR